VVLCLATGWLLQSAAEVQHALLASLAVGLVAARLTPNPPGRPER
jgi:hypothetical protein